MSLACLRTGPGRGQIARGAMNYAKRQGWLPVTPFERGEALINVAHERQRDRVLTRDEETRLLAACETPARRHLRSIIIGGFATDNSQECYGLRVKCCQNRRSSTRRRVEKRIGHAIGLDPIAVGILVSSRRNIPGECSPCLVKLAFVRGKSFSRGT